MVLALGLLLLALGAAEFAPGAPLGKFLRKILVEAPARELNRLTPFKLIVSLIVVGALLTFLIGAPELVAMIGLGDLAVYLDVAAAGMLLGVMVRWKPALAAVARCSQVLSSRVLMALGRMGGRNHVTRRRRPKTPDSGEDVEPGWGPAFA